MCTIIPTPRHLLFLHSVNVLLRSVQGCLPSSVGSHLNLFACSTGNLISPVQPQFRFHRILGALARVSNIGFVAFPKYLLIRQFCLAFLMLLSLPGIPGSTQNAFFVKLFWCPLEELNTFYHLFLLHWSQILILALIL